jgi:hypothetical protein
MLDLGAMAEEPVVPPSLEPQAAADTEEGDRAGRADEDEERVERQRHDRDREADEDSVEGRERGNDRTRCARSGRTGDAMGRLGRDSDLARYRQGEKDAPERQTWASTSTIVITARAIPPTVNTPTVRKRSGASLPLRSARSRSR